MIADSVVIIMGTSTEIGLGAVWLYFLWSIWRDARRSFIP